MSRAFPFLLSMVALSTSAFAVEPFWRLPASVAEFQRQVADDLAAGRSAQEAMIAVKGPRTTANTLVPYDQIQMRLNRVANAGSVLGDLHPDAAWREAGRKAVAEVQEVQAALSLDRRIHDALAAIGDVPADAKWYVQRTLDGSKREGVLLPEETRQKIAKVRHDLTLLQQKYTANLGANRREMRVPASQLDSMPSDFLKSHPAGADGMVTITNDAADHDAVITYAQNAALRRQVSLLFLNRGYPDNQQVVADLIHTRHELARLTGAANFAEYASASRMVGTAKRQSEFLASIDRGSAASASREMAELLAQKRKDDPQAERLNAEDLAYYQRLVRESKFNYDVRQAREYLPYAAVKDAVLRTAAELFALEFRPLQSVATWHPSVEVYEVTDHGKTLGRFYLDMHQRANKFQHFASRSLRTGGLGQELPETVLLCNFPDPAKGPALIEPGRARTFFHEFGHLLHAIFSGQQRWAGASRPEQDFMEAPSQLLEEWLDSPELLVRFTRHYKTGEQMPIAMARTLIRAKDFGKARQARWALAISRAFLDMQDDAEPVSDAGAVYRAQSARAGLPTVEGSHQEQSISHMGNPGYAAAYYAYLWSQVIAKDLFTRFDPKDLLSVKIAREYLQKVLEPGGSKPAATLVENFLGRPFDEKAYERWLSR